MPAPRQADQLLHGMELGQGKRSDRSWDEFNSPKTRWPPIQAGRVPLHPFPNLKTPHGWFLQPPSDPRTSWQTPPGVFPARTQTAPRRQPPAGGSQIASYLHKAPVLKSLAGVSKESCVSLDIGSHQFQKQGTFRNETKSNPVIQTGPPRTCTWLWLSAASGVLGLCQLAQLFQLRENSEEAVAWKSGTHSLGSAFLFFSFFQSIC